MFNFNEQIQICSLRICIQNGMQCTFGFIHLHRYCLMFNVIHKYSMVYIIIINYCIYCGCSNTIR